MASNTTIDPLFDENKDNIFKKFKDYMAEVPLFTADSLAEKDTGPFSMLPEEAKKFAKMLTTMTSVSSPFGMLSSLKGLFNIPQFRKNASVELARDMIAGANPNKVMTGNLTDTRTGEVHSFTSETNSKGERRFLHNTGSPTALTTTAIEIALELGMGRELHSMRYGSPDSIQQNTTNFLHKVQLENPEFFGKHFSRADDMNGINEAIGPITAIPIPGTPKMDVSNVKRQGLPGAFGPPTSSYKGGVVQTMYDGGIVKYQSGGEIPLIQNLLSDFVIGGEYINKDRQPMAEESIPSVPSPKLMYDGGVVRMAEGGDPLKPVEELSPRQPEKPSDIDDAIDWIRRNVEEGIPFDDIANNLHRFSSRVIRELPTALKATARFIPGLSQISSFLIDAKPLNVGETEWLEEQNKLADETVEKISVFPKPQKMFPENDRPAGGEYLNPETQEKLTNKNMSTGNISITPEGKPSFQVNPEEKEVVGSPDIEGATQIKTNLFKKKAGWKWIQSPEGYNDISTLVSVENKGNHYYTINAEFPNGINLTRYPKAKSEPRLRPTMKGMVKLGKEVGRISVRGKEHPVYDQIINYFEGGQV